MITNFDIHPTARISDHAILRGAGRLSIGAYVKIEEGVTIDVSDNPASTLVIKDRSKVKTGSVLKTYAGAMEIGPRTSIGEYNLLAAHGGLFVGSECMFGPYVFVNTASHIVDGQESFRFQGEMALGVEIGSNVWLGARSSVLDGVRIGSNCVVGAHSLVLKSLPNDVVAFGQPAIIQRKFERGSNDESIC